MLLTLVLFYEQSRSAQKDPHGLLHEQGIMKLKAMHAKNLQDWGELKQLPNKVNSEIRIVKESYYKQSFTEHKNDSQRTWQTTNELYISQK